MLNKQLDYYKKKNRTINDTEMNIVRKNMGLKQTMSMVLKCNTTNANNDQTLEVP
jgi:hypothetical protein